MIDVNKGFFLYARVSVEYNGRAKSIIGPVNLTILHKVDGALVIHGANGCLPINYQRPKSVLIYEDGRLKCRNKDECITIEILKIYHYYTILEWSSEKLRMTGTEKQLCDMICDNINDILGVKVLKIDREMPVRHGSIDILAMCENAKHVIEVKRKRATKDAVFQLRKYVEEMGENYNIKGYIAAPDIGQKALDLMREFGYTYLNVKSYLVF